MSHEISQQKLKDMYFEIRIEEATNLKTKRKTDAQMINRIASIIKSKMEEGEKNEV